MSIATGYSPARREMPSLRAKTNEIKSTHRRPQCVLVRLTEQRDPNLSCPLRLIAQERGSRRLFADGMLFDEAIFGSTPQSLRIDSMPICLARRSEARQERVDVDIGPLLGRVGLIWRIDQAARIARVQFEDQLIHRWWRPGGRRLPQAAVLQNRFDHVGLGQLDERHDFH